MVKTRYLLLILISSLAFLNNIYAQTVQLEDSIENRRKKVTIIPLPVIASNPTTGFMFGAAPGFNWYMGNPENTTMSTALATGIYTTNKQIFFTARGNTFLNGDKWNILSDIRFLINSQPTYGLGTGNQFSRNPVLGSDLQLTENPFKKIPTSQMLEFNYFRFYQTVFRRHKDTRFFYGLGYHLDIIYDIQDNLLNLDDSDGQPISITHHYAYNNKKGFNSDHYSQSGISANVAYDSRDNVANPYTGRYAFVNFRLSPQFLGSSKTGGLLWAESRNYLSLSKARPRHLIAFWTYGHFVTGGKVPYMFLPATGWDMFSRSGRPYTQGRFRGEDLIYNEVEYRFPLLKNNDLLGGVLFVNAVTASSRTADIDLFRYFNFGYGAGLRVMINKVSRINLALDYAFGKQGAQGFFLGMNEAF